MKKRLTALVLSCTILCAMSIPGLAAEAAPPTAGPLPDSVLYYGQVTQIETTETGTRLAMESEAYGAYLMNISPDTVWIDSGNCTADSPASLTVGERLYVFHSPISTRSVPPQSAAFAVVRNIPQDASCAHYHIVEALEKAADGSLKITTDNGAVNLSVGSTTNISDYASGKAASLDKLTVGDRIMAWYNIAWTSYPSQSSASHIMLLPAQATGQPLEGDQLTMELNGKVPNMVGRYESGTAMVPLAAVAQSLGFQVTYSVTAEHGPLVTVESDTFAVYLSINQKLLYGSTKIPGAAGTTGPQDYGKAAYIVAPGTTWAPAELFQMLGKTVTLEGGNLVIR